MVFAISYITGARENMRKTREYRKPMIRVNPACLDNSGKRYFEPYLSEVFAALGLFNMNGAPVVVHGLNAWVCLPAGQAGLETEKEKK